MSDYKDNYYKEVDSIFSDIRNNPFRDDKPLLQPTPQEKGAPLGPSGWVENNDGNVKIDADGITILNGKITVKNGSSVTTIDAGVIKELVNEGADVTIDEDGITILNGKLSLQDASGESVLSAAGFAGAWMNFLVSGVYNGNFAGGTTDAITAVTETGGGDTAAEYAASLSDDIPYWVVKTLSGTGTFKRKAYTGGSSGFALVWDGAVTADVYQDVPVVPGQFYSLFVTREIESAGNSITQTIGAQYHDADHNEIGTINNGALIYSSDDPLRRFVHGDLGKAPANARYLRVHIKYEGASSTVASVTDVEVLRANTAYINMPEVTTPSSVSTNEAIIFTKDNGAGKTQLCVKFASGAVQVIATQP